MNRILAQIGFGLFIPRKTLHHLAKRQMSHLERPGQRTPVKTERLDDPVKFTSSGAFVNYRASDNFYGGDDRDLPNSHNFVLAASGIFGIFYLIILRDDVDADGGAYLYRPVHETVPQLAVPLIRAAIAENTRLGYDTQKLQKKLAELLVEQEKVVKPRKLVEN